MSLRTVHIANTPPHGGSQSGRIASNLGHLNRDSANELADKLGEGVEVGALWTNVSESRSTCFERCSKVSDAMVVPCSFVALLLSFDPPTNDGTNMTTGNKEFALSWQRFLIESVLLRDHAIYYVLLNARGGTNPIVERFAPGILYVKMVALLDEALVEYMAANDLQVSNSFRNDLNGRIGYLDSLSRLTNAAELHRIRKVRNRLAHESSTHITWEQLHADTALVHSELRHLGFVGDQPLVEAFAERGVANFDHGLPGISHLQDYVIGARVNGVAAAELKWSSKVYCVGWDEERVQAALERGESPPTGLKK